MLWRSILLLGKKILKYSKDGRKNVGKAEIVGINSTIGVLKKKRSNWKSNWKKIEIKEEIRLNAFQPHFIVMGFHDREKHARVVIF